MSLLGFFQRRGSAPAARDRLQLLLAYERSQNGRPDVTAILQKEILEVIQRHFPIDPDKVQVKLDHGNAISTLEIDIEMPGMESAKVLRAG